LRNLRPRATVRRTRCKRWTRRRKVSWRHLRPPSTEVSEVDAYAYGYDEEGNEVRVEEREDIPDGLLT